jgi:hypothetical protein
MTMPPAANPKAVIERLMDATKRQDLEAFVNGFAENYESTGVLPSAWFFRGRDQVRANWAETFSREPGTLQAQLLDCAVEGNTVWSEMVWTIKQDDGMHRVTRGVIIWGVAGDRIMWGRFYVGEA